MILQESVFEKGSPGLQGWSIYAILAGACLSFMLDAPPESRWAGVALIAGGLLGLGLFGSSWLRKPLSAGLSMSASTFHATPAGAVLARWFRHDLDLTPGGLSFMTAGVATTMILGAVAQVFHAFSRYIVVQFDAVSGTPRSMGRTIENIAGSVHVIYASTVHDERRSIGRAYLLVERSHGLEKVQQAVRDAVTISGARLASPVVVSSLGMGVHRHGAPENHR